LASAGQTAIASQETAAAVEHAAAVRAPLIELLELTIADPSRTYTS
jgi:hypothetical protein